MRASQWLVGFSGLATIVGTIATGCSGDDTATPPGNDASTEAASSGGSSGGSSGSTSGSSSGSSSGSPSDARAGGMDCGATDAPNVATFDSGSSTWACFQKYCGAAGDAGAPLVPCAANSCCDNAVQAALLCSNAVLMEGGPNVGTDQQNCFISQAASGGPLYVTAIGCLTPFNAMCNPSAPMEGGTDGGDAGATDAPHDGG